MKKREAEETIACLPNDRTLFYYFKDKYALSLLAYAAADGVSVNRIRLSPFAQLLQKPIVKRVLAEAGDGVLSQSHVNGVWSDEAECYVLTLGLWGDEPLRGVRYVYRQTSRPGFNLVLQLNFSNKHDRTYTRLIKPRERHPFEFEGHPIHGSQYRTLAWARIDVEFETGEALIEEIQSDWIGLVTTGRGVFETVETDHWGQARMRQHFFERFDCDAEMLDSYVATALKPHLRMWDEATLAAAISFIRDELGFRTIYYHSFESGVQLKGICGRQPPRSLYTDLPRRFCFQKADGLPKFLRRGRWARSPIPFDLFRLDV